MDCKAAGPSDRPQIRVCAAGSCSLVLSGSVRPFEKMNYRSPYDVQVGPCGCLPLRGGGPRGRSDSLCKWPVCHAGSRPGKTIARWLRALGLPSPRHQPGPRPPPCGRPVRGRGLLPPGAGAGQGGLEVSRGALPIRRRLPPPPGVERLGRPPGHTSTSRGSPAPGVDDPFSFGPGGGYSSQPGEGRVPCGSVRGEGARHQGPLGHPAMVRDLPPPHTPAGGPPGRSVSSGAWRA